MRVLLWMGHPLSLAKVVSFGLLVMQANYMFNSAHGCKSESCLLCAASVASRIVVALCTMIFQGILAGHFLRAGNAGGLQQLSMSRISVLQMSRTARLDSIS